jgi:hypothetical protein
MFRVLLPALTLFLTSPLLPAGEIYYTGFENFTPGPDTIAGTDGWTGSSSHAGRDLSGILAETSHLVSGIGNAAYIGGNNSVFPVGVTNRTVNVRRAFNLDPVALGQEIAQLHVNLGIKDSTYSGLITRRDNFDIAFYNGGGQLLGFIQFDNTTIDTITQFPAQKIWRSSWNGTEWTKMDTGINYFHDELLSLRVRINFRTNRWSATLDDLSLFADQTFYTGSNARNLGSVAVQMQVAGTAPIPGTVPVQMGPAPGDNYLLFDDFALRLDPVPEPVIYGTTFSTAGSPQLTWLTEALYRYQVQYTDDLSQPWKSDLPNSSSTATATGVSPVFTDGTAAGKSKRYYRIARTLP